MNMDSMVLNRQVLVFLDVLQDGALLLSSERTVIYCNQTMEKILDLKMEEMLGKDWEQIFALEDRTRLNECLESGCGQWIGEIGLHSGLKKGVRFSIHTIPFESALNCTCILAADITGLLQESRELQQSSMAKDEFLAGLSHEARTSLLGILGYCDILGRDAGTNQENEPVDIIRDCARQLLGLVNRMIDLAKIECNQVELESKTFSLHHMLHQAILSLQPSLEGKAVELDLKITADTPDHVIGDEVRIRQVLTNLLSNAIKFTEAGRVEVQVQKAKFPLTVEPQSISLQISVSDTGIGVEPGMRDKIFLPYMTSEYHGYEGKGIGLGLAISKQLVELMRGLIWFESNGERGSCFSFAIPLQLPVLEIEEAPVRYILEHHGGMSSAIRVLLAEDRRVNRILIKHMLEQLGCSVITASNGQECIRILQDTRPDVIFMDMQMPVMDGFEATRKIRQSLQYHNIPIVALTAHALKSDIENCMQAGCDYYLSKPFTQEELCQALNTAVRSNEMVCSSRDL